MRQICFATVLACLLPAAPAAAQLVGPTLTHPGGAPQVAQKKAPPAAKTAKACSEYGAGYVRIEGTGTCMKIGGYVRFQAGVNSR